MILLQAQDWPHNVGVKEQSLLTRKLVLNKEKALSLSSTRIVCDCYFIFAVIKIFLLDLFHILSQSNKRLYYSDIFLHYIMWLVLHNKGDKVSNNAFIIIFFK